MSILRSLQKGLASAGLVTPPTEEEQTVAAPTPVVRSGIGAPVMKSYPAPSSISAVSTAIAADPGMVKDLEDAMNSSTIKGYVEFQQMVHTMGALPENMRMTAALAALGAQKITVATVLESIDDRKRLLEAQAKEFDEYVDHTRKTQIGGLLTENEVAQREITTLEAKINTIREQMVHRATKIQTEEQRLGELHGKFAESYSVVHQRLQTERQQVSSLNPPSGK